jgi:nitrogen fixation protein NifQ
MNAPHEARLVGREASCRALVARSAGTPADRLFARLLASLEQGVGAMPARLGLSHSAFAALLDDRFPGVGAGRFAAAGHGSLLRGDEYEELVALFLEHAAGADAEAAVAAAVLAAGCMANDHLWQDMGFWSRADLSAFIAHWFPALAAKNDRDMKWKKFFYKQLCDREGVYACRAPSCAVCVDYSACFGPEG